MPATEAMIVMLKVLEDAGCLVEPSPPKPAMTVDDAARLLCRLSGHVRLSEPDVDFQQLLGSDAMVTFAWTHSVAAGIPSTEMADAQEARRLLIEHHRTLART